MVIKDSSDNDNIVDIKCDMQDYSIIDSWNVDLSSDVNTAGIDFSIGGNSYSYTNSPYTISTSWPASSSWANLGSPGSVTLGEPNSGKIDLNGPEADILFNGVSVKDTLAKIQERLAILVPDPALLEKYEALQVAYEQYKLLEALCQDADNK